MNYVKPSVEIQEAQTVNEAITWTVVALSAIIAAGGYAAWCTYNGADFVGAVDIDDKSVQIGCSY
ncbi:hypothetical protein LCM20_12105 [Halobacillus litoralis]|uniref:hypothetical protein n=1 Tax=Halobacillus litoralis TaxID=45668 RepID=UPI001CD3FE2B|nr:hypothetical protein [Halobacillus litoralis]MCA0971341.1 hypothetical protein [Halobacillus litoralis]